MEEGARNALVHMIWPTLDDLPAYPTPSGYALRTYQPGDEAAWVAIHVEADRWNCCDLDTFRREFGTDPLPPASQQVYLCDAGGRPIGTATGWLSASPGARPCTHYGEAWGRIHWVALLSSYQGRGLARLLLAAACQRLREMGHQHAYLTTSTARIPAINLYLSFGFQPEILTAASSAAWESIRGQLKGML